MHTKMHAKDYERRQTNEEGLIRAASGGCVDSIDKLIEEGVNVNCKIDDATPLMFAAIEGRVAAVRALVKNNCNVNSTDAMGTTALMIAAMHDQEETVALLSEHPTTDIHMRDKTGATAFMYISQFSSISCARRYLRLDGVDVNEIDDKNHSVLMLAASKCKDPSVVELLLSHGADMSIRDAKGRTALMYAIRSKKQLPVAKRLIEYGSCICDVDDNGMTALMHAVRGCNFEAVEYLLLREDCVVNHQDGYGMTALMYARSESIVDCLVLKGFADVEARDNHGRTPLMYATLAENEVLISRFLELGANPNATDRTGATALILAARDNLLSTMTHILQASPTANVSSRDHTGYTALDFCIESRYTAAAKLLQQYL